MCIPITLIGGFNVYYRLSIDPLYCGRNRIVIYFGEIFLFWFISKKIIVSNYIIIYGELEMYYSRAENTFLILCKKDR